MRHDEGARQPTGHAQSPLSSAFPIIILLDSNLPIFKRCMLMGTVPKTVHLELPGFADNSGTLVLLPIVFMGWKIMFFICAW